MSTNDETRELAHMIPRDSDFGEGLAAFAATQTAQQAVLPRQLKDGELYAVLVEDRIELLETPGYIDSRDDRRADQPRTIERNVTVTDGPSLIRYLAANTWTDGDSDDESEKGIVGPSHVHSPGELEVWADVDARTITAYLDGGHGWRRHSATLRLKHSREWQEWTKIDGQMMGQTDFAQFIEDHISTIAQPDGAQLVDICQTLQANTKVDFKSSTILKDGARQFRYEETTEARAGQRGDLTIPGELLLALRPFVGSTRFAITARFRYRLTDGVLRLGVRLSEPDATVETAFDQVLAEVAEQVPVPILSGRP